MKTIYLVRHGEYENPNFILPNRLKGFPLSEKGRSQIIQVAKYLKDKNIDIIYSSPILRTKQSAQILQTLLQKTLIFSKSIIELASPLQGMNLSIISDVERYGDTFKFPLHFQKGGETVKHVIKRMKRLLRIILLKQNYSSTVIVSHGDPIMVCALTETGYNIDARHAIHSYNSFLPYIPKGGIIKMEYEKDTFQTLQRVNF